MKPYQSELGQMLHGQPFQRYDCPGYVTALLRGIDAELERVVGNIASQAYASPFDNTAQIFKNGVFEVDAYSWNEDIEQPYNFKCGDIEISWYKYCGRGMSVNRVVTPKEMTEMFTRCIASVCAMEQDD